ncbi:MFS transporter [Streptomyces bauhiniae]|uniref:MFS transporter n=1 Tax=Streptomyces bauhiniae TaxID=2340725 RepID=UPI0035D8CC01
MFRTLWCAQLFSNIGTWMQTVAAQWMLVHQPHAATLTSAVQAASLLPVLLVSLPGGVLADVLDRRRLLIGLSLVMTALTGALAALTAADLSTPTVLLVFTFALGCCQALTSPAWQSVQPELVPRDLLPAAAALGSMNVNLARAVGPALAGVLVAVAGPATVFLVNAASNVAVVAAIVWWRRPATERDEPERVASAFRAGTRYVRHAPGVRRILLRALLFVLPASALWGLLPVVADERLHQGSSGYGVLLGSLGVGAVAAAAGIKSLRARFGRNTLMAGASLAFAAGCAACALLDWWPAVALVLVVAGAGWLVGLSTLNTVLQLALPGWVRARALAVYLMVFLGGQGVGALLWGLMAGPFGVPAALLLATLLLVLSVVSLIWLPVRAQTGELSREVVQPWAEPVFALPADPGDVAVLVELTYRVAVIRQDEFRRAVNRLAVSRRRTGAVRWGIYRDAEDPEVFVEVFEVLSWKEHLRQHSVRTTAYDADLAHAAAAFSDPAPAVRHLVSEP